MVRAQEGSGPGSAAGRGCARPRDCAAVRPQQARSRQSPCHTRLLPRVARFQTSSVVDKAYCSEGQRTRDHRRNPSRAVGSQGRQTDTCASRAGPQWLRPERGDRAGSCLTQQMPVFFRAHVRLRTGCSHSHRWEMEGAFAEHDSYAQTCWPGVRHSPNSFSRCAAGSQLRPDFVSAPEVGPQRVSLRVFLASCGNVRGRAEAGHGTACVMPTVGRTSEMCPLPRLPHLIPLSASSSFLAAVFLELFWGK